MKCSNCGDVMYLDDIESELIPIKTRESGGNKITKYIIEKGMEIYQCTECGTCLKIPIQTGYFYRKD